MVSRIELAIIEGDLKFKGKESKARGQQIDMKLVCNRKAKRRLIGEEKGN
jgi:hypothetical protein